ncbi:MAG TPA: retroviral-like aspartic protease family protein [Thermoanaerobaculia bacterium]|nr:retroviral-like aspartic protease family protein [Thermoanaerobaculia bacterium]
MTLLTGCALYSDVAITPLFVTGLKIDRGSTLYEMVDFGEYGRASAHARFIDRKDSPNARELATLGRAELASGRLDLARTHLRMALDLRPPRELRSEIAWDLSQTEYLANNFASSREWALEASREGMRIKPWHMDYLEALSETNVYRMTAEGEERVAMQFGKPDIPRIPVKVNDRVTATAVIDSGAVLSIISEEFAAVSGARSLGSFRGTFYGLLGEPISVTFGLIDSMNFGNLRVENIPVAIMPDEKLHFFVHNDEPFRMDLLLGTNLLKEFRLEFDFRGSWIGFTPLVPGMRAPAENQNLFFVGFRPLVQTSINRRGWYLFLLDTGSEVTFLNGTTLSKTNVRNSPKIHGALMQGLGGAQQRGSKIENVDIGVDRWAGAFKTLPLYGSESNDALGILGQNYLKNFRVILDFGRMRLDLEPPRGFLR